MRKFFKKFASIFYKNIANFFSILGILPLYFLLDYNYFSYFPAFIIYNNVMDDLDGILAKILGIQSRFGAILDNVCDSIAHVFITLLVATHYKGVVSFFGFIAVICIIIRVVQRLENIFPKDTGSPTNELMRHILFIILLDQYFPIEVELYLSILLLLNSLSMLAPIKLSYMIRGMSKNLQSVILVNILLIIAWQISSLTLFISILFIGAYLYSFFTGGIKWLKLIRV